MKTERMWALNGKVHGGHTLRFVTASKIALVAAKPGAGAPNDGDIEAPPAVAGAPALGGFVSVLLDEQLTLTSVGPMPVPLLWNSLNSCMNNNAQLKIQDILAKDGKVTQEEVLVGDATEVALLRASQQAFCGVDYWTTTFGLKRVLEFAFDSDRKRMSVVLELPPADDSGAFVGVARPPACTHLLLVKGAPEAVLNKSISFLGEASAATGVHPIRQLTEEVEDDIETQGSMMADKGMRVLATAFRFLTSAQVDKFKDDLAKAMAAAEAGAAQSVSDEPGAPKKATDAPIAPSGPSGADLISFDAEKELAFIGLAGIMDPPRVEVADAIAMAHTAGIRVCMITGDHFNTGLAIAKQIGIYDDARGDRAMNGDALAVLSEEQLSQLTPFPVVFTRVSPDNKLKLVKSLQRRGEIVAMTGDGVNGQPRTRRRPVRISERVVVIEHLLTGSLLCSPPVQIPPPSSRPTSASQWVSAARR